MARRVLADRPEIKLWHKQERAAARLAERDLLDTTPFPHPRIFILFFFLVQFAECAAKSGIILPRFVQRDGVNRESSSMVLTKRVR